MTKLGHLSSPLSQFWKHYQNSPSLLCLNIILFSLDGWETLYPQLSISFKCVDK